MKKVIKYIKTKTKDVTEQVDGFPVPGLAIGVLLIGVTVIGLFVSIYQSVCNLF